MDEIKRYIIYILMVIGLWIFSSVFSYIGLNASYKNLKVYNNNEEQVNIKIAQATKVNGRIYGEVISKEGKDLNGKYIKVDIYNKNVELLRN